MAGPEDYRPQRWRREWLDGVEVLRAPQYVPARVTGQGRLLQEISFTASCLYWWLTGLLRQPWDAVVAVCPPMTSGLVPGFFALLSVAITTPTNNTVFTAPATFTITAVPAGGATPYARVQFFVGTNLTGVANNSPFTSTVSNLLAGTYNLSAVVTDANSNTATNSVLVSVNPPMATNYIVPAACGTIYSSGTVISYIGLTLGSSTRGGLEFAEFNTSQYSSVLLELNAYGLPLFGSQVSVYGFDGGTGTLTGANYNSGTLIGVWTLPPGLTYGQPTTYDVTSFVKSTKGPYFGFILYAVGDVFSSTGANYGLPPELYAIGPVPPPQLTITPSGNQIIISWSTNNAVGLSLKAITSFGTGATWNAVNPLPVLVGNQWVVTNSIIGASRYFRLSSQ